MKKLGGTGGPDGTMKPDDQWTWDSFLRVHVYSVAGL